MDKSCTCGTKKGLQRGREEGLEQGQAKMIQHMYESGMSPQVIAGIVQLTVEDVLSDLSPYMIFHVNLSLSLAETDEVS